MALNSKENFGKPISKKLSDYLRENTTSDDRANVSQKTGISMSTVRDVTYRKNSLTKENSVGIIELMKIAIKNCEASMTRIKNAKQYFEEVL